MLRRLALLVPLLTACVTGGSNAGGVALGGVVVYSAVAQDAQAKDAPQGTAAVWCGALRLTQAQRGLWKNEPHADDEWAETLATPVYQIARDAGYALHRTQTRELILDAKNVNEDPVALDEALKKCPGPT